jgi:hypothetical protein
MFAFDRSAVAVIVPLALLVAVVLWSQRGQPNPARGAQAVAASLPSR